MKSLNYSKVRQLRDQFIHLSEKTCMAAAMLENYLGNTTITHKDFAEVGPDLLSHVQGCLSDVYEAMDPEKHWESTDHSSLSNLCVRNDEFLTLAEVAIPTDKRNLIPPPEFPADFGHWPIRFNFQLVWESARFLTFTPGFVDEYLRKWQRGPRPASLSDHWGWDHRTGAIIDKPNWDILSKFHDMGELLGKLKVIHDSSVFSHGVAMRFRLREEFAAIARACPPSVADTREEVGNPPQENFTIQLWEIHLDSLLTWREIFAEAKRLFPEESDKHCPTPESARKSVERLCEKNPLKYRWVGRSHGNKKRPK